MLVRAAAARCDGVTSSRCASTTDDEVSCESGTMSGVTKASRPSPPDGEEDLGDGRASTTGCAARGTLFFNVVRKSFGYRKEHGKLSDRFGRCRRYCSDIVDWSVAFGF